MSNQSTESGFHKRVYSGHLDNYLRKLRSAENADDLQKVMQTVRLAAERNMIEPSQVEFLQKEYEHLNQSLRSDTA